MVLDDGTFQGRTKGGCMTVKDIEEICEQCGSDEGVKTVLISIKPVKRKELCNKCYHKKCERDCKEMNKW